MQQFLDFIRKYHFFILFVFLEIIAFSITANNRKKEKAFFMNSSNFLSTLIYNSSFKINEFFSLRNENDALLNENIQLKNKLRNQDEKISYTITDTTRNEQFLYIGGKVVKNSILSFNNYITVNKGKKDGIEKDMAVLSAEGVVGIVVNVSKNYCIVLSVLNTLNSIGCKLKSTEYFGSAKWDADDYRYLILTGIPNHVTIKEGDTVVTSGYGYIFPEDVPVGTIDSFWKTPENNFYTIKLLLTVDLKRISKLFLVKNLLQKEQRQLEQQTRDLLE